MSAIVETDSIRIVDMPDLGAVTDSSSVVGEHLGSGLFSATAFRTYVQTGLPATTPPLMDAAAEIGVSTTLARADHVHPAQGAERSLQSFGADPTGLTDSTAAIQDAFDFAGAGGAIGPSPGVFCIASPLTLVPSGGRVWQTGAVNLGDGCYIKATAAMGAMITIGSAAVDYSGLAKNLTICLGTLDGNNLANTGVLVAFANHCMIRDTQVTNWLTNAFVGGSEASPAASHEICFDNCRTIRAPVYVSISAVTRANPGVVTTATAHGLANGQTVYIQSCLGMTQLNGNTYTVAGATATTFQLSGTNTGAYGIYGGSGSASPAAPTGSIGIYYDNSTDSLCTNCVIGGVGYAGISANPVGGDAQGIFDGQIIGCHVWNYVENGVMTYGFDLWGDTHVIACKVDGPCQYGYHFRSINNSLVSCQFFVAFAQTVVPYAVSLDTGAKVTAVNCNWKSTATPIAADATGYLAGYQSISTLRTGVTQYADRSINTVSTWAYINAATVTVTEAVNVSGVLKGAVGDYTIQCNTKIDLASAIICQPAGDAIYFAVEYPAGRTDFAFRMRFFDASGAPADPAGFSVMVVGYPREAY